MEVNFYNVNLPRKGWNNNKRPESESSDEETTRASIKIVYVHHKGVIKVLSVDVDNLLKRFCDSILILRREPRYWTLLSL